MQWVAGWASVGGGADGVVGAAGDGGDGEWEDRVEGLLVEGDLVGFLGFGDAVAAAQVERARRLVLSAG